MWVIGKHIHYSCCFRHHRQAADSYSVGLKGAFIPIHAAIRWYC
jgi:hypothetical protein